MRVAFRELTQPSPGQDWGGTYTYVWALRQAPEIGSRAFVRDQDGKLAAVVVTAFGVPEDLVGFKPAGIVRVATERELARTRQAAVSAADADGIWLDMMRTQAGLPASRSQLPRTQPNGYPPIPPAQGTTRDAAEADAYARAWWRAFKHDDAGEAAPRFRALGQHWYDVRDAILDPERAAAAAARRTKEVERQRAGAVRGRFFGDWLDDVQQLKREQRLEEAHDLLVECIAATWRADGPSPAIWPFEQAAIVLRKMKRPEDEVAVLRAYVSGSAEPSPKLVERLGKLS